MDSTFISGGSHGHGSQDGWLENASVTQLVE